jgi:gliding motility-associated-like protein
MCFFYLLIFVNGFVSGQNKVTSFQAYGIPQTGFLRNLGQVRDVSNKAVDFVYYHAKFGDQQVFVTNYGLSILFARAKKVYTIAGANVNRVQIQNPSSADSLTIADYELERIDVVLRNAIIKSDSIVSKRNIESPSFNFYIDDTQQNWQETQLQSELVIKNVYPGIDWRIYINNGEGKGQGLKYDFIVHPGADPSRVQVQYSNNARITLENNEITAATKMGVIKEDKPFSYFEEDRSIANVVFKLNHNTISFLTDRYDKSKTLVIDPSIYWMTYLSSTNPVWSVQSIYGRDVETDAAGNIFVQLSAAANVPFPTVNPGGGAYYQTLSSTPNGAMVIMKFTPGGQMLWSTYFGNCVGGRLMTIDKFGNIVAMGNILPGTPSVPVTNPSIPLLNNGGYFDNVLKSHFICKFSNSGVLLWSTYYADFSTYPMDMSFDINGNIYIVGWSQMWGFPVVDPGGGAYMANTQSFGAAQVLFISQFNSNCQLTWSTRIEGNDYDPYARVCTDNLGNIYIGGQTRSTNYPLVNAGGFFDANSFGSVITRFNAMRQMTWSTYFPGAFSLADITTDDSCNLYVVADKRIIKFNSNTQWVFQKTVNSTRMHFWKKIMYDPFNDQIQILGIMNDNYFGFPTQNTACNGSFFNNGISPHTFPNATGPIFATIDHAGNFSYLSLVDWVYEYYDYSEMTIDPQGNPIYLFFDQQNGYSAPNPQLTNPGNGAYFDQSCCYQSNGNKSALLLKLHTSELLLDTVLTAPVACNCDGSAEVVPLCGQAPFTYLWSNGITGTVANGLCPGNYWVKVTDATNLSKTLYINIPYPPGSISAINTTVIPENCNQSNGSINVQLVQGGILPYTFSIDGITYTTSSQFVGLDSGSHIIRVRDGNGCVFLDTILLSRISGPTNASYNIKEKSCIADDGSLQILNVQGGVGPYQYSLSGNGTNETGIFTNLSAGSYQLMVTDTAGCSLLKPVLIPMANPPNEALYLSIDDHCSQGMGQLQINNVTGGTAPYTFSIDSINFLPGSINSLNAGTYSLFVKDSNGCVLTKPEIVIGNITGPTTIAYNSIQAYCGKLTGELTVTRVQGGSGSYQYSLDNGPYSMNGNFTGIQPGNHTVYIRDAFNCVYSQNISIDFKPIADIKILPQDTTICYDETINLVLAGDITQLQSSLWSIPSQGSSAVIKVIEKKEVYVVVRDNNNCIIRDTAIINVKTCSPPERCVVIPTAFTPNNDGKNETMGPITNGCRIKSIEFFVYNRWGQLVFKTKDLINRWNGVVNGIAQSTGVFVFVCNYITDDGISRTQKGVFTLIR